MGDGRVLKDEKNLVFITEDPNHYPQVKWSNEEPSQYDSGITLTTLCENEDAYVPQPSVPPIQNASDDTIDMIQNPPHYKQYSFEPIDIITEVVKEYPPEIGFHVGTTLKYLFRSPFKGKQAGRH